MDIVSEFHQHFDPERKENHDFELFTVADGFMLGVDKSNNAVVVCKSNNPNRPVLMQKTKMLTVEFNVSVSYSLDSTVTEDHVHIIRCRNASRRERDIFIELSTLFIEASAQDDQEEAILEIVAILSSFFANTNEPSDRELQGLFAELYTLLAWEDDLHLSKYWQSKDRMKFDFSVTDTVKIEVKSTTKNTRQHHFRHEQLTSKSHSIYVISYLLRPDDEGCSLLGLIISAKELLRDDPRKLLILDKYLKNTSEKRLDQFRFNEPLLQDQMRIYRAKDIPKFNQPSPDGVFNAEYDCLLDLVPPIDSDLFVEEILSQI